MRIPSEKDCAMIHLTMNFRTLKGISGQGTRNYPLFEMTLPNREAMFYKNVNGQNVQCLLCPRECVIGDGKTGFCRNRENQKGKLYTIVYGKPSVVDIGPIEKAPLDGTKSYL